MLDALLDVSHGWLGEGIRPANSDEASQTYESCNTRGTANTIEASTSDFQPNVRASCSEDLAGAISCEAKC
jgi:hypothetical protein